MSNLTFCPQAYTKKKERLSERHSKTKPTAGR